ncbi:MAG: serine hydrolase, partial [Treponema sp.]|nr:serine hydrolase [Treponema sp.]
MNKKLFAVFAICVLAVSNVYAQTSTTGQPADEEWRLILDRVNLLVDNHFENRNFSTGQNANWNITGLSVGVYKNGRTAFFSRGYHESQQRRVANRRPVTENSIFPIGSVSKPISTIMLSYFSRLNNPRTGRPYVNLNDPVNNYFPTRPYIDTDGTQVHPTLLQFVTHYGGIAIGGGSYTL